MEKRENIVFRKMVAWLQVKAFMGQSTPTTVFDEFDKLCLHDADPLDIIMHEEILLQKNNF